MSGKILNKKGLPYDSPLQTNNKWYTPITNRNKCITDHVYIITVLIISIRHLIFNSNFVPGRVVQWQNRAACARHGVRFPSRLI